MLRAAAARELAHIRRAPAARSERKRRALRSALQEPPDQHHGSSPDCEQFHFIRFTFPIPAWLVSAERFSSALQEDLCLRFIASNEVTVPSADTVQACAPSQVAVPFFH